MTHFTPFSKVFARVLSLTALLAVFAPITAAADTYAEDFSGMTASSFKTAYSADDALTSWYIVGGTIDVNGNGNYTISKDVRRGGSNDKSIWTSNSSNTAFLVTPELTGLVTFYVARYSKYAGSVNVYDATLSGTTFTCGTTALKTQSYSKVDNYSSSSRTWDFISIDLGSDHKRLAIVMARAAMDDFTGTVYEAPAGFSVYSDEACTTKLASGIQIDFGLTAEAATQTVYIKNETASGLTGLAVSHTGNAVVGTLPATLAAGAAAPLTIAQAATGATSDEVTVTADGGLEFTVSVKGTVKDPAKFSFGFSSTDDSWPSSWTVSAGSVADGTFDASKKEDENTIATIVSSRITVAEGGETLYFRHFSTVYDAGTIQYAYVKVYTATTGNGDDANWTLAGQVGCVQNEWQQATVAIPAAAKYLKIEIKNAKVDDFYGLEADNVALFASLVFESADYDFGVITADAVSGTYTVGNSGNSDLTGLLVTVDGDEAFTVSVADNATTIAAGGSATFTVGMKSSASGVHTATVTVKSDNGGEASFKVTGTVMPSGAMTVDFNDNQLPVRWTNGATPFTFDEGAAKGTKLYDVYSTMTTPKVIFTDGGFIAVKAKSTLDSGSSLLVEGSADGTSFTVYSKELPLSADNWQTLVFSDIPASVKWLRFTGKYALIDEITGLAYAAELAVTDKDGEAVADGVTYDFGEQNADATVSYTFGNAGVGELSITTVSVACTPDDGTFTTNWTEAAAVPFTLDITQHYAADKAGEKSGTVTVTMSDGTSFAINVKGIVMQAATPKMEVFVADATEAAVSGTPLAMGMATDASESIKISNPGTGALTITGITVPTGFSLAAGETAVSASEESPLTVAAGESVTLTLTIAATGAQSGTLSFAATGFEPFTLAVSGYKMDTALLTATFDDNQLPAGWLNSGWTFAGGLAVAGAADCELTTPIVTVADGERMAIAVTPGTVHMVSELKYQTSVDGGSTWSAKSDVTLSDEKVEQIVFIGGIAAGNCMIKLTGFNVSINAVNGFTPNNNAPIFAITDAAGNAVSATASADFGSKLQQQPEPKEYTIYNKGTGTLAGTIVSSSSCFTVSKSEFSLSAGESMTFAVSLVMDDSYGDKSGTVTVHPTSEGMSDVVISLTANTFDPQTWREDFADGIPSSWLNDGWTVGRKYNEDASVSHATTTGNGFLVTPRLVATAGQTLTFEYIANYSTLVVEYAQAATADGAEWQTVGTYADEQQGTLSFTAPADGNYYLRFSGSGAYIDDFEGFRLDIPAVDVVVTGTTLPESGEQFKPYTASVTVENKGTEAQTVVVSLLVNGVEQNVAEQAVASGASATVNVSYTPEQPVSDATVKMVVTLKDVSSFTAKNFEGVLNVSGTTIWADNKDNGIEAGSYAALAIKLNLAEGYNTVALPVAVSDVTMLGNGVQAYALKSFKDGVLKFEPVSSLNMATPYLLTVESAGEVTLTFSDVTVSSMFDLNGADATETAGSATMQGTYVPVADGSLAGKFIVNADGSLSAATAETTLNGFRAWFTVEGVSDASLLTIDLGLTDGISSISIAADGTQPVYNLRGQRVQQLVKGRMYVQGGKKFIAR